MKVLKLLVLFVMWFLMLLTFAVESVVSAAVVATVTTRFLKTSYANVFLQFFVIQMPLNNYLYVAFYVFIKA